MVNFENSKIYKIISDYTDMIYIGSTTNTLCRRFSGHKKYDTTSVKILKYDDCKIILIEEYACENRDQLRMREQFWIDKYKKIKVNKNKAFQNDEEKKKYKKKHRLDNIEHYKEVWDTYYDKNKEILKEVSKKYYNDNIETERQKHRENYYKNRDKILEEKRNNYDPVKAKIEYEKNKDKIQLRHSIKYDCDCGAIQILLRHKKRHETSKRHINNT